MAGCVIKNFIKNPNTNNITAKAIECVAIKRMKADTDNKTILLSLNLTSTIFIKIAKKMSAKEPAKLK